MKANQTDTFGVFKEQEVLRVRLTTDSGYQIAVMNYGATLLEYVTPDKEGNFSNVVLNFEDFDAYIGNSPRFGASIGPVAGRIAGAHFQLDGQAFQLEANNGSNHLHGGSDGFESTLFEIEEVTDSSVTFYTKRSDGVGGYPGNLEVWISFHLSEEGRITISYRVTTDQDTLVNPTNHSYFNLSGDFSRLIDQEVLTLNHDGFYPISEEAIPQEKVETEADFLDQLKEGVTFQEVFQSDHPQIKMVGGLDHPFVLSPKEGLAASILDPDSGRLLTLQTDASHLVIYTANVYDEQTRVKGQAARVHNGVALECQERPDAIHHQALRDSVILRAHQAFESQTSYQVTIVY